MKTIRLTDKLVLGTAMWGWSLTERQSAWNLLDYYVSRGMSFIDTAWNYPINKNPEDMGLALKWLAEWAKFNKAKIFCKIGATNNLGTDETNLSGKNIISTAKILSEMLGESLWGVGIHWDNRETEEEIFETVNAINEIKQNGYIIGLSGIKCLELYKKSGLLANDLVIQVKENLLTNEARSHYQKEFPYANYWGYGINFAGFSLSNDSLTFSLRGGNFSQEKTQYLFEFLTKFIETGKVPMIKTSFDFCLIFALLNENLSKIIVGSRTKQQLEQVFELYDLLKDFDKNQLNNLINDPNSRLTDHHCY